MEFLSESAIEQFHLTHILHYRGGYCNYLKFEFTSGILNPVKYTYPGGSSQRVELKDQHIKTLIFERYCYDEEESARGDTLQAAKLLTEVAA